MLINVDKSNQEQEIARYKEITSRKPEDWTYEEMLFVQANYKKLKYNPEH